VPELPDIEAYLAALRPRVLGARLERVRITGFSLLKSYDPPISAIEGHRITELRRLGKRLVFGFGAVPGRGRAAVRGPAPDDRRPAAVARARRQATGQGRARRLRPHRARVGRPGGTLVLTEAGTKKRASLHLVRGEDSPQEHDRGGIDPLTADLEAFAAQLQLENRTLKRALTDPRRFSGIGNAFSDEILHAAGLSPVQAHPQPRRRRGGAAPRGDPARARDWIERLQEATGDGFPEKVTAFRPEFAVHGKHGEPCPVCGTAVQRIRYADNETNYCPRCQTGGKLLADRSLSRLLKDDWPRTIDQLEGA
jgi:formamidopyrimidine-DNA glycosylase